MKKPKQVRLYLNEENERRFGKLSDVVGTDLSEAQIASLIVSAGLNAIEQNGYHFSIPLRFSIEENFSMLREKPAKK